MRPGALFTQVAERGDRDEPRAKRAEAQHPQRAAIEGVPAQELGRVPGGILRERPAHPIPKQQEIRELDPGNGRERAGGWIGGGLLERLAPRGLDALDARLAPSAPRADRGGDEQDGERSDEGARRDGEREGDLRVAGEPDGLADYCLTSFLSTILILSPIL
jgi:hypothetical protein